MERTESIVVQVAPGYENDKIKEMQLFGWNLQSRQEIMGHLQEAETPDNLFVAIGRGMKEGATGKKTYEYDHYVKLHFVRDLNLPNLSEIKKLENEYYNLHYPVMPSLTGPIILLGLGVLSFIDVLGGNINLIVGSIFFLAIGSIWMNSRIKKRKVAIETRKQSEQRGHGIGEQLSQLMDCSNLQYVNKYKNA